MRHVLTIATLALPLPALAEVPAVVTDIAPVHSLVQMVLGDLGQAQLLLDRGGNAHSFQLRPSQAVALRDAELLFWVGEELTPWLGRAITGAGQTGKAVGLLDADSTLRREFASESEHDDHDAQAAPGADAHGHDGIDPHAWLEPENARAWLAVIASELAAADPDNAATYAANAAGAEVRIAALEAELAAKLAPVRGRPFVVFHDAYGYFAGHFGLSAAGAVNLGDATAPGAAHLQELRGMLDAGGVVCAFPEAQHDPKQLLMLSEGTPVRVGGALDPLGSALPVGPKLYEALLRGMADTLSECLAR